RLFRPAQTRAKGGSSLSFAATQLTSTHIPTGGVMLHLDADGRLQLARERAEDLARAYERRKRRRPLLLTAQAAPLRALRRGSRGSESAPAGPRAALRPRGRVESDGRRPACDRLRAPRRRARRARTRATARRGDRSAERRRASPRTPRTATPSAPTAR